MSHPTRRPRLTLSTLHPTPVSEIEMATRLLESPLVVTIDAGAYKSYLGGVMGCSAGGKNINHAVQIVGFNDEGPQPYWVVRNSWGPAWGMSGYAYHAMHCNAMGIAWGGAVASVMQPLHPYPPPLSPPPPMPPPCSPPPPRQPPPPVHPELVPHSRIQLLGEDLVFHSTPATVLTVQPRPTVELVSQPEIMTTPVGMSPSLAAELALAIVPVHVGCTWYASHVCRTSLLDPPCFYDERCSAEVDEFGGLGCNAGGVAWNCRFCGDGGDGPYSAIACPQFEIEPAAPTLTSEAEAATASLLGGVQGFSFTGWVRRANYGSLTDTLFHLGTPSKNGATYNSVRLSFGGHHQAMAGRQLTSRSNSDEPGMQYLVQNGEDGAAHTLDVDETFPPWVWVHVVVVHASDGIVTIYWDGELKASGPVQLPVKVKRTHVFGGMIDLRPESLFRGIMRDVILTASAIEEHDRNHLYTRTGMLAKLR